MSKRILLAALLGGIGLFFWGFLSHVILRLGEVGIQNLPQDEAMMASMKAAITQPGFYFFPPEDPAGNMPAGKVGGPHGILIYHPSGASAIMTSQLVNEFILNVVQAFIAAFLLSLASGPTGYLSRVGFVALVGLLAGMGISIEYWTWYGFPANYTAAMIADKLIGFLVVGLVAAAFVKSVPGRIQAASAKAA